MEKTAQATLSAPITVQGKKTDILTLRRATLGDDEDAMDMAISFNRGNNPVTVELCTLSIVTGGSLRRAPNARRGRHRGDPRGAQFPPPYEAEKEGGGRNRDGYDARGRLHGLRLAMLSLAKFSGWSRTNPQSDTGSVRRLCRRPQRIWTMASEFGVSFSLGANLDGSFGSAFRSANGRSPR